MIFDRSPFMKGGFMLLKVFFTFNNPVSLGEELHAGGVRLRPIFSPS
jgi:hypothetical protein